MSVQTCTNSDVSLFVPPPLRTVIEKKAKLRMRRTTNETCFGMTSNNMLFVQVGQGDCQTIAKLPRLQETQNRRNAVRTTMALQPLIADDVT
eukprot:scaffold279923_cov63-Attheya_sp.AAC.1